MTLSDNFKSSGSDFDWSPFPNNENSGRWTAALKERIVHAIHRSEISAGDVQARYKDLSDEELASWINRAGRLGRDGLMVTKGQMLPTPR